MIEDLQKLLFLPHQSDPPHSRGSTSWQPEVDLEISQDYQWSVDEANLE